MTTAGEGCGPGNSGPFLPPGSPPMRETLEGWEQWRRTRYGFVAAPRLDLAAWRALSPRRRMLHDLHRAATHANLPLLQTPMTQAVTRLLHGRIRSNALKHKPTTRAGVMVTGGGYQGKTETTCEIAATFQDAWLDMHRHLNPDAVPGARDLHAPVAYVQTPVTAKPKSTCKAILGFYGAPLNPRMDLPDLVRQVATSLHDHGTKALLLDDITRLRLHRAGDQDTLDLLRAFMSMHVTLVLVGVDIPGSGLLTEGRFDPGTRQWILPPSRHAGIHRAGSDPDRAAFRPGRAGPLPLRRTGPDHGLGRPPGRGRTAVAAAEGPHRHADHRPHARIPLRAHQRSRRPS